MPPEGDALGFAVGPGDAQIMIDEVENNVERAATAVTCYHSAPTD
jgi:hypothetical protein